MTWRLGHRGACGHAPENTLLSVQKALDFGVDGFEFDIQLSKDGHPMVIHDDTLNRTTNASGLVLEHTLKELQQIDASQGQGGFQKIPSLHDIIDVVNKRCRLFIELKAEHSEAVVAETIKKAVEQGWSYEHFYVCAFDHAQLAETTRLNKNIRTCALFAGIPVSLAAIGQEVGAWSINPCIHHMNEALVKDAHARSLKVITWTVNHAAHIAKAKALKVDGIFSDYPDRL
jgi:glycerophosphoryl diester phosphodiesterase